MHTCKCICAAHNILRPVLGASSHCLQQYTARYCIDCLRHSYGAFVRACSACSQHVCLCVCLVLGALSPLAHSSVSAELCAGEGCGTPVCAAGPWFTSCSQQCICGTVCRRGLWHSCVCGWSSVHLHLLLTAMHLWHCVQERAVALLCVRLVLGSPSPLAHSSASVALCAGEGCGTPVCAAGPWCTVTSCSQQCICGTVCRRGLWHSCVCGWSLVHCHLLLTAVHLWYCVQERAVALLCVRLVLGSPSPLAHCRTSMELCAGEGCGNPGKRLLEELAPLAWRAGAAPQVSSALKKAHSRADTITRAHPQARTHTHTRAQSTNKQHE